MHVYKKRNNNNNNRRIRYLSVPSNPAAYLLLRFAEHETPLRQRTYSYNRLFKHARREYDFGTRVFGTRVVIVRVIILYTRLVLRALCTALHTGIVCPRPLCNTPLYCFLLRNTFYARKRTEHDASRLASILFIDNNVMRF